MPTEERTATHHKMAITFWTSYINSALIIVIAVLPILIGTYYGRHKKNSNSISEYMMHGGKSFNLLSLSLSFIASHVSGITLLEVTNEVYKFGLQFYAVIFSFLIVTVFIILFYLPVFYKLQLNSPYEEEFKVTVRAIVYDINKKPFPDHLKSFRTPTSGEYIERRFDSHVRLLVLLIILPSICLYLMVNVYVPATAISKVSGISVNLITVLLFGTCVIYTAWGGLRAVVWIQSFQIMLIFFTLSLTLIVSCTSTGSLNDIIKMNEGKNRLEMFNMDINPFSRTTFWTIVHGLTFQWLAQVALNPISVHRMNAASCYTDAKIMIILFPFGAALITTLCCLLGLTIYAKYINCHPFIEKENITQGDIFSYFISDLENDFPSLQILFLTVMVNAALSMASTALNSVADVIYEEIILKILSRKLSHETKNFTMKITVTILGIASTLIISMVENLDNISQLAISFINLTNGAVLFVFTFGMVFPWGTSKGALSGLAVSLLFSLWMLANAKSATISEKVRFDANTTQSERYQIGSFKLIANSNQTIQESISLIQHISFMYFTIISALLGMISGLIVTLFTGTEDVKTLEPDLIIPQLQKVVTERQKYDNTIIGYELIPKEKSNILQ